MKIAIVTLGTRGDVQPYVGVARALMDRGHDVWIAVTDEHAPLIRSYGVAHRSMRGSFRELLRTDLGRAWLSSGDSPRDYARYAKELFRPLQRAGCEDADAAVEGADAVVFYVLATGALHAAQRRKLPAVFLSPWAVPPTRALSIVPTPFWEAMPGFVKKTMTHVVLRMGFSAFNAEHNAYRADVGLPPFRSSDLVHFVLESGVPGVHLFSETVLPRPRDWDARHAVAGFAFAPAPAYDPPRALVDFLAAGEPPVYVGFGSMTGFRPEELAALAADAARLAGVRAVIASGWAGLTPPESRDVFVVDELPHEWLFPRVSAVVHHGGAGTFAQGLRAGKPTVIAAFFGDQPFWGRLNERLGTGPRALRRKDISAASLAAAIRNALSNPRHRERAEAVAASLRTEDGSARAAELIEGAIRGGHET